MTFHTRSALVGIALGAALSGGCASGVVKMADKDTSGAYDGDWVGTVQEPSASRVSMPGNWYSTCKWEPFDVGFTVEDGIIQARGLDGSTPVAADGAFRLEAKARAGRMISGVMSGNAKTTLVYQGSLGDEGANGNYHSYLQSIGANGCAAPVHFRRG